MSAIEGKADITQVRLSYTVQTVELCGPRIETDYEPFDNTHMKK